MTVKIIKTGELEEYEDSYAVRLMEQGKALAVEGGQAAEETDTGETPEAAEATDEPAEETPEKPARGRGKSGGK